MGKTSDSLMVKQKVSYFSYEFDSHSDDKYSTLKIMKLQKVALIVRKTIDNKLLIMGSSLDNPIEIIDDNEYLFIGELEIKPKHIFHEYKYDKGNTPNEMLSSNHEGAGLNYKNYKNKLK